MVCRTDLGAGAEISSGPAVAVLPLGETEPAVGVAAVEGDRADKQLQTGRALQHTALLAKCALRVMTLDNIQPYINATKDVKTT